MIFNILLSYTQSKFWGSLVILFIIGLGYLANKLTKGIAIGYINYKMNEKLKKTLVIIHGLSSLIFALALPNNYLNQIDFFKVLYDKEELWIAGSILILLFFFIIAFGITLTLITAWTGLDRSDKEESIKKILNS